MSDAPRFVKSDRIEAVDIQEDAPPPAEIEQERRVAIYDLVEENKFHLKDVAGPYRLTIARLEAPTPGYAFDVAAKGAEAPRRVFLDDPELIEAASDYLALCGVYRDAVRRAPPSQIERADAERRAAHDEASELLRAGFGEAAQTDGPTARRLFTLCCALEAGMEKLL